jgi:Arc/MetJ family transcription regulator
MDMRTTLDIDEAKLRELMRLLDLTTKTEAIELAIDETIRARRRRRLVDLAGKVRIAEDWRELRDRDRG